MKLKASILALATLFTTMSNSHAAKVKVATFNVSMEALNYVEHQRGEPVSVSENTLTQALNSQHPQIANIAEIIQRVRPDIILLNEFDNQDNSANNQHRNLRQFINDYLNKSQNKQAPINYPYFYQGTVNTGVNSGYDLDGNGKQGQLPGDGFGYGHFSGHFGMAILSKYPIQESKIRSFQYFKWQDMPGALKPINPENNSAWFSDKAWQNMRLSSKSHWDVPIKVNDVTLHILASHPTPPVFDGPEDRNGKRNHDEIRFWHDYISDKKASYIYDDKGSFGGLNNNTRFVILGDLNASNVDGDALTGGINNLLNHPKIQDAKPISQGGQQHSPDNPNAAQHTAVWRMRADYVLPSKFGLTVTNSGVFWPAVTDENYRLIKDRKASSDHRLVWLELETNN
ncbi:endonuclease/exonuclease/phosphatase family protein [Litorilituus sediminis]|uniref:Endonuclease/exonuclease/phosphatase family protein n=1 Tax=Litorilituus sediminis TaxID=718192 RepID=A0A4P6P6F5_9GAMM|nr:endonuclease/exonuclease/phosphatase family protein [Litorilituus sediminis]QBG35017.1 endonuclease/exonuclease/phosphatase family protein [Litorilituus sediminis]